jgi:hypothetical protein
MRINKKAAAVAVAAVTLAGAGAAYAYWTTSGTGDGTVASQSGLASFKVAQTAVSGTPLYPTATQAVGGTVKNDDLTAPAQLQTLVATIKAPTGPNVSAAGKPACTAADYTLSGATWTITAGGSVATIHPNVELTKKGATGDTYDFSGLTVTMVDRADTAAGDGLGNQDNCKGATFNVTYDAS